MRFFVANGAPQNDGGFLVALKSLRHFALDAFVAWATSGKEAAEPPHARVLSGAMLIISTMRVRRPGAS
jgi:hypothetical protein